MSKPSRTLIYPAVLALMFIGANARAAEQSASTVGTIWDGTVNSLLATGMYGLDDQNSPGLTIQLQHSDNLYHDITPDASQLSGQAITFSYEGSSGLLGFSAGYILTSQQNNQEPGTVFLGVDPSPMKTFDPGRFWYMAFDLSRSYQVDENISFQLGNRTMLLKNPFDTKTGHIFSVLFNMPISYKDYFTITPELQWSRPLSPAHASDSSGYSGDLGEKSPQDVFYGGVSIHFSY